MVQIGNIVVGVCFVMLRVISRVLLVGGIQMCLMLCGFHFSVKMYEAKIIMSPTILVSTPIDQNTSYFKSLQPFKTLNSHF
jgi:hypothetical protein